MELTVLMENQSRREGLSGAHGLSVWVRAADVRLLFDTGPNEAFLQNAGTLGIDLSSVTAAALSHNHWDHTGGLDFLLDALDRPILLHTGKVFFRDKYAQEGDARRKLSHLVKEDLTGRGVAITEMGDTPLHLGGGLYLMGGWDTPYLFETPDPHYVVEGNGGYITDPFAEEIALVHEGDAELIVLSGCAHPGIAGMVRKVTKVFHKPVHTLLGGVHLMNAPRERVEKTAEALSNLGVKTLGLAHCSGEAIRKVWEKKYGYVADFHVGDGVVVEVV